MIPDYDKKAKLFKPHSWFNFLLFPVSKETLFKELD